MTKAQHSVRHLVTLHFYTKPRSIFKFLPEGVFKCNLIEKSNIFSQSGMYKSIKVDVQSPLMPSGCADTGGGRSQSPRPELLPEEQKDESSPVGSLGNPNPGLKDLWSCLRAFSARLSLKSHFCDPSDFFSVSPSTLGLRMLPGLEAAPSGQTWIENLSHLLPQKENEPFPGHCSHKTPHGAQGSD